MKDLSIKISIILYSIVNLIYCIIFIGFIGGFLVTLYGFFVKQLISNFLT